MPESESQSEPRLPGSGTSSPELLESSGESAAVADAAAPTGAVRGGIRGDQAVAGPTAADCQARSGHGPGPARRVLEYVIRESFRRYVPEKVGTRPLDNLVARLVKDEVLDAHVKGYVDQVRELGNAAAHGAVGHEFSEADAFRALDALLVVLEWYFKKEKIGDIDQLRQEVAADEAAVRSYQNRTRQ